MNEVVKPRRTPPRPIEGHPRPGHARFVAPERAVHHGTRAKLEAAKNAIRPTAFQVEKLTAHLARLRRMKVGHPSHRLGWPLFAEKQRVGALRRHGDNRDVAMIAGVVSGSMLDHDQAGSIGPVRAEIPMSRRLGAAELHR